MAATYSSLDIRLRSLWAKSGDTSWHSLLAHMLDVAASAEVLLERESGAAYLWAAQAFGLPPKRVGRWIAAIVGLHDFGKGIPGFQAKWPQGKANVEMAGLPFSVASLTISNHAGASAALLMDILSTVGVPSMWAHGVLQAISAHHGYNFNAREIQSPNPYIEGPAWGATRKMLFVAYWATLAPEGSPTVDELQLAPVEWLAGLTDRKSVV